MKSRWKVLLAATMALALNMALASAAFAHGFAHGLSAHGESTGGPAASGGPLGFLLLPPEFVLGVVAFFGVLYAVRLYWS